MSRSRTLPPGLTARRGIFYHVHTPPAPFRMAGARKQIWVSLKTRDLAMALTRYRIEQARLDVKYGRALPDGASGTVQRLQASPGLANHLAELLVWQQLAADDKLRSEGHYAGLDWHAQEERLAERCAGLRAAYAGGSHASIVEPIQLWMASSLPGVVVHGDSPDEVLPLLRRMHEALIELTEVQLARWRGEVRPTPEPPPLVKAGISWAGLVETWQRTRKTAPAPATIERAEEVVASIQAHARGVLPADITKVEIQGWVDQMMSTHAPKTVETRRAMLRTLFQAAVEQDELTRNAVDKTVVQLTQEQRAAEEAKGDGWQHYRAFTAGELKQVFGSKIWAEGWRSADKKAGGDAQVWLPILLYATGARVSELAKLLLADVRYLDGVGWYLEIGLASGRLKTTKSIRAVPLPQWLIDLGFVERFEGLRAAGEERLFPELNADHRGNRGGGFSEWFSEHVRNKIGLTDRYLAPCHSFRSTYKQLLDLAGVAEADARRLLGHRKGDAHGNYSGPYTFPPERADQVVRSLEWPMVPTISAAPAGAAPRGRKHHKGPESVRAQRA